MANDKVNKLALIPAFMDVAMATQTKMLTAPFRGKHGATSYRREVGYAAIREVVSGFTTAEGQYLSPKTSKVYKKVAKSRRWQQYDVDLGEGAMGHWIGPKDAKYVMIYFHGGGYISYAQAGHLKYQCKLQKAMWKQGHDFAIFSLAYTLAPHAVYPTQISQAVSALRHLIEHERRDPSTILLGGDSAGGNLASALMLHLAQPIPAVPPLILDRPLRAALLISPWVAFDTTSPSFFANAKSDYLTITALHRASHAYIGPSNRHNGYSEPVTAPREWWTAVGAHVVSEVMIWAGGGEILLDGIKTFAEKMAQGFGDADRERRKADEMGGPSAREDTGLERVKLVVTPRMAHEEMIIDYILKMRGKGEGAREIERWLDAVLRSVDPNSGLRCLGCMPFILEQEHHHHHQHRRHSSDNQHQPSETGHNLRHSRSDIDVFHDMHAVDAFEVPSVAYDSFEEPFSVPELKVLLDRAAARRVDSPIRTSKTPSTTASTVMSEGSGSRRSKAFEVLGLT